MKASWVGLYIVCCLWLKIAPHYQYSVPSVVLKFPYSSFFGNIGDIELLTGIISLNICYTHAHTHTNVRSNKVMGRGEGYLIYEG